MAQRRFERVGPYAVTGELARGGMGLVLRGRGPGGREVAIKVLLAGAVASATQRQRFRIEAAAAQRLAHRNVVAVLDAGEEAGTPFIVMELVPGESLQARLQREGPLPEREAAQVALDVARALEHAHAHGVVHRDVKPHNVLLRPGPEGPAALLADFGLAKDVLAEGQGLTLSGQFLGTPHYVAPEQARGERERVGPASDVYALGATLYAMLAGGPPFAEIQGLEALAAASDRDPPPPSALRRGLDRDLEAVVLRALQRDPRARTPSAGALARELQAWLESSRARRARARVLRGLLVVAAPVVAGALGVGLAVAARAAQARALREAESPGEAAATRVALGQALARAARGELDAAAARERAALELAATARADGARPLVEALLDGARDLAQTQRALLAPLERADDAEQARGEPPAIAGLPAALDALEGDGALGPDAGRALRAARRRLHGRAARSGAAAPAARASVAQAPPLELTWREQARRLGPRRPALAVAARALVALGPGVDGADAALARWTRAEADAALLEPVLVALVGRGDPLARQLVSWALLAADLPDTLAEPVSRALGARPDDPLEDPVLLALRATDRRNRGDRLGAARELERALARDPACAAARLMRAMARADERDHEGALADLRAVTEDWASLPCAEGLLHDRRRDRASARVAFDRAVLLAPWDARVLANRAAHRLAGEDVAGAVEDAERALRTNPRTTLAWRVRGEARRTDAGLDLEGALEDLERARQLSPDDAELLMSLAAVRSQLGDTAGAVEVYDRVLELDPSRGMAWLIRGNLRSTSGDVRGALGDLAQACLHLPQEASAWAGRGQAHFFLEEYDQAIEFYQRAYELQPQLIVHLYRAAGAYVAKGDHAGAERCYDRALAQAPDSPASWLGRARAREQQGNLQGALDDLRELKRRHPGYEEAYVRSAALREAMGDRKGAARELEALISAGGESALRWLEVARARRHADDLDGAVQACGEALRIEPWAAAFALRADLCLDARRWEEAVGDATRALEHLATLTEEARRSYAQGVEATALRVRGLARLELGKIGEGERDLREFLAVAPDDPKASIVRARLGGM